MSKKDFDNMLSQHEKVETDSQIDWKKTKKEWLDFIEVFYNSVENWLKPYMKQKKLKFSYTTSVISEDYIGSYKVKKMLIVFAGQQVIVEPVGTLLIGTKGRIDMEGTRGRVQFILADKDSKGMKIGFSEKEKQNAQDWTWKIVVRDSRSIAYNEFNEDNFFSALMEITNG